MNYISTRGQSPAVGAAQAILNGLAPDGGLYVPETLPRFTEEELNALPRMSYRDTACLILGKYLDFSPARIRRMVRKAYRGFDVPEAVRIMDLAPNRSVLELWHGPSCAFKDMALELLPYLLTESMKAEGIRDTVHILTATSGDTGKAALVGFADVPRTKITVYYPDGGVSPVQEAQMTTQKGRNVNVVAIHGNFDDAQTAVKRLFGDSGLAARLADRGERLSSANSINWGRLLPQIVYFTYTAARKPGVNFSVPTGNFGDILAGYISREMGAPIGRLHCASNENKVLTDFFATGLYDRRRPFKKTCSPSMDILISSNLERLLYFATGDAALVSAFMADLAEKGYYQIAPDLLEKLSAVFTASYRDDAATKSAIGALYRDAGYLMDPHTAVAFAGIADREEPFVVLSTASPYKFPETVLEALGLPFEPGFPALEKLSQSVSLKLPKSLAALPGLRRRFREVREPDELSSLL